MTSPPIVPRRAARALYRSLGFDAELSIIGDEDPRRPDGSRVVHRRTSG